MEPVDHLADCRMPDGGLLSMSWYLRWYPWAKEATLDGEFTAAELRAIADHMDKHGEHA